MVIPPGPVSDPNLCFRLNFQHDQYGSAMLNQLLVSTYSTDIHILSLSYFCFVSFLSLEQALIFHLSLKPLMSFNSRIISFASASPLFHYLLHSSIVISFFFFFPKGQKQLNAQESEDLSLNSGFSTHQYLALEILFFAGARLQNVAENGTHLTGLL